MIRDSARRVANAQLRRASDKNSKRTKCCFYAYLRFIPSVATNRDESDVCRALSSGTSPKPRTKNKNAPAFIQPRALYRFELN
ncbi:hypothetical protein [Lysobacter sp. CA199]|uniref:hypothetical protein n=1 Tax=Lysobacter sp. CA199 TaxID=3455608 RepID=UPI003F8D6301